MNNRFVGAGIGLLLIIFLIIIVSGAGKNKNAKAAPGFNSVKEFISKDKLEEAKQEIDTLSADEKNDAKSLGKSYFDLAAAYEENNEIVKARDLCGLILKEYNGVENILEVQEKLGRLNVKILFSSIVTDNDVFYEVEPGDNLSKIAKKFNTTVDLIKTSNSLANDMIRVNARLKVSKNKYKILVDKSQNVLTLFTDDDNVFKVYRVSTGENNCSPVGTFEIINKMIDPVWYTEGAVVPAESPDNILGTRWLGISEKGYGIHGTVEPDSLGTQATKGCVRMLNSEVEELYTIVPVGTEVTIMD
jgi:lipoprotein-anchoring transpeptidase ErfK/SrfK